MKKELTPKQQRFVEEYRVDLNATQAAIRAGYSAKTAGQIGDENLKKPQIAAAVESAMEERAQKIKLTAEWVITRLMREAEYFGDGATQSARVSALGLLGKHLAMFTDKFRHKNEYNPVVILPADADLDEYLKNALREEPAS